MVLKQVDWVAMLSDAKKTVTRLEVQLAEQDALIKQASDRGMVKLSEKLSAGRKRVAANLEFARSVAAELEAPKGK